MENTNFTIRKYRRTDETGWLRCRVLSFLGTAYFDDVVREKPQYDYPSVELVAELDGAIVGLIDVECEKEPGAVCSSDEHLSGMIWHVAVHPDFQHDGIGSALLEETERLAKRQGMQRLEAWTRDDPSTNEWYRCKGFHLRTSYLHVYMERDEIKREFQGVFGDFTPMQLFAHYQEPGKDRVKKRFKRVHECRCYEEFL
ncbi:MAG TPA: GNAT family N-acetyltransferase [Bacillales bacterium]|nr:GNAT family N-acetyltransferase [Bacillales bacterium]